MPKAGLTKTYDSCFLKDQEKNPQKLTQHRPRYHPRHLVGKRTTQKDTKRHHQRQLGKQQFPIQKITGFSNIQHLFYLLLYLYATRKTISNNMRHLKSSKNQKQKSRLGTPRYKTSGECVWGVGGGGAGFN